MKTESNGKDRWEMGEHTAEMANKPRKGSALATQISKREYKTDPLQSSCWVFSWVFIHRIQNVLHVVQDQQDQRDTFFI